MLKIEFGTAELRKRGVRIIHSTEDVEAPASAYFGGIEKRIPLRHCIFAFRPVIKFGERFDSDEIGRRVNMVCQART